MSDFDNSVMTFSYSGFGRNIHIKLTGEEADYLPKAMATFAEFCRAVGFVWVSVDMVEGESLKGYTTKNYLFRGNYKWDDETPWAETYNGSEPEDWPWSEDEDHDAEMEALGKAAADYWDEMFDEDYPEYSEDINAGDTVFYHGHGAPETTLNDREEPQAHGGRTGVTLVNMKGTVVAVSNSPVGPRVLVKWSNWNDGHNGMGDDPNAIMSAKNYWWSNINNVSKSN